MRYQKTGKIYLKVFDENLKEKQRRGPRSLECAIVSFDDEFFSVKKQSPSVKRDSKKLNRTKLIQEFREANDVLQKILAPKNKS